MERTGKEMKSLHPNRRNCIGNPEFFSVFIPDLCTNQLCIPQAFQKHLRGIVPRIVKIRTLANQTWTVYLERQGNDLFFTDGWEEFVKEQPLECGDFFVCRYELDSTFFLKIYGTNGCGKGSHLVYICNGPSPDTKPRREEAAKSSRGRGRMIDDMEGISGQESSTSNDSEWFEGSEDDDKEDVEEEAVVVKEVVAPKKKSAAPKKRGRPPAISVDNVALDAANRYASSSPYPNFTILLTQNYIRKGSMYIPSNIVLEYMKGKTHLFLQVSNRLWRVRVSLCSVHYKMSAGWPEFVKDNHLEEGDVCLLELIQLDNLTMNASIFRGGEGAGNDDI